MKELFVKLILYGNYIVQKSLAQQIFE